MRIKIFGNILQKDKTFKTNYSHEIQSMILQKLSTETAHQLHEKQKFFRLLTFTNICINKETNSFHFYMSGCDEIVQEFINYIIADNIIRIDDMVLIAKISSMPQLQQKPFYKFKTNLIINVFDNSNNKNKLCEDFDVVKKRLIKNSIDKCTQLGLKGNIDIEILQPCTKKVTSYKLGHIFSWKCKLLITGDYDMINAIYNVGIGENTFTGHGFLWEV